MKQNHTLSEKFFLDVDALTDNSGGTTDETVEAVSGSGADAAINNNFAELSEKLNTILDRLKADA